MSARRTDPPSRWLSPIGANVWRRSRYEEPAVTRNDHDRDRDHVTGQFVSDTYADAHPEESTSEIVGSRRPVDPVKYLDGLRDAAAMRDIEEAHQVADGILISLLDDLGYGDVTTAWQLVPRWYS